MLYPVLTNSNEKIMTTCLVSQCFKDEDIEKIKNRLDSNKWKNLGVYAEGRKNMNIKNSIVDTDSRKVEGQMLPPDPQDGHPFPQLSYLISNINNNNWNFDIRYINFATDPPAVFKYEVGGKHNWHLDCTPAHSTRKLSYSIQLSDSNDYEGGDLEFFGGEHKGKIEENPDFRKKGNIIVFPSYIWHHITPITKGIRYVMVGWIHGPSYK